MNTYLTNIIAELKETPYYNMMTHIDVPIICGFISGSNFNGTADEESDIDIEFFTIGQTSYPWHGLWLDYKGKTIHWNYIPFVDFNTNNLNESLNIYGWGQFLNSFPERLYIYQNPVYASLYNAVDDNMIKYRAFFIYLTLYQQMDMIDAYIADPTTLKAKAQKKEYWWVYLYEYLNGVAHNYDLLKRIKRLQAITEEEKKYVLNCISYLKQWYVDNPYDIEETVKEMNTDALKIFPKEI